MTVKRKNKKSKKSKTSWTNIFKNKKAIVGICIAIVALVVAIGVYNYIENQNYIKDTYPLSHTYEILDNAQEYDLDPILVAGVIRAESKFEVEAESKVGARGLMQIMPDTGEWIAEKQDIEDFNVDSLYEAEVNVDFGCWYLSYLLDRFEHQDTALAAYNAGPTNVSNWLSDERYSDDGETLKDIPFEETKNYVEKVNSYKSAYLEHYETELLGMEVVEGELVEKEQV